MSSPDALDALRLLQGAIIVLGIVIIYHASKGYRKTRENSLLFLALGFLFFTGGAVSSGFLFELMNFQLIYADIVEALLQVISSNRFQLWPSQCVSQIYSVCFSTPW